MQTWGRIPGKSMQMCLSHLSSHAGPWAPRWSLPKAQLLFLAQGLLGRQRHHRKQGPSVTDGWFGIKSGGPQLEREKYKHTRQVLRSSSPGGSYCFGPQGWGISVNRNEDAHRIRWTTLFLSTDSSIPKQPKEKIHLPYRLLSIIKVSQDRSSRQELKKKPRRNVANWLSPSDFHSAHFIRLRPLPKDSTTHSGVDPQLAIKKMAHSHNHRQIWWRQSFS